jgi:hypothetical protein
MGEGIGSHSVAEEIVMVEDVRRSWLRIAWILLAVASTDYPLRASEPAKTVVRIEPPMASLSWALLERELLRANHTACLEFFDRYFDDRGYLECVERWGGDDAIENVNDWPVLYAIGGDDAILARLRKAWEGCLRQYTEARTTDVPFARYGMYYKEFPVMFDWFHHGEGLSVFNLEGL